MRRRRYSIGNRLSAAFVGLAVGPLLAIGILLVSHVYSLQKHQALLAQQQVIDTAAAKANADVASVVTQLSLAARLWPTEADQAVRATLATLLASEGPIVEIAHVGADGRETARLTRIGEDAVSDADLRGRAQALEYVMPMRTGRAWFGPVEAHPATGLPAMTVSLPVPSSIGSVGVLAAVVSLGDAFLVPADAGQTIYVLDAEGRVVAHSDASRIGRRLTTPLPAGSGITENAAGDRVMMASASVRLGDARELLAVAERPLWKALGLAIDTAFLILTVLTAALVTALALATIAERRIVQPLQGLTDVARRIQEGDIALEAEAGGRDEIATLAASFNSMTGRLRQSLEELELRVEERTRNLSSQITERIYAEKALRESEQRFRDITEAASDWFWEIGSDLRFRFLSPREGSGDGAAAFLGRTLQECLEPAEGDAALGRWEALSADLAARRGFRDVNGRVKWCGRDLHLRASGKPFHDADGVFAGYRGTLNDITAEVEAEGRAAQAQRRLLEAIEVISEGFLLCDADDRLVLCNGKFREFFPEMAEHLVPGDSFEELLHKSVGMGLVDTDDADDWLRRRRAHRRQPASHIQTTPTGRWLLVNERRTESGHMVGVYTDISELKRGEQALVRAKAMAERATEAKSQFLANMSHELRTPLNAIIGFSDAVLNGIDGPIGSPRYQSYVEDIHASGMHLLDLINDILDLSKVEAGKLELSIRRVDISGLVAQMAAMVRDRAVAAGLKLVAELAPDLPPLLGDERRLKQIFLNLLSNAIKFTPGNGRVTIRVQERDGDIVIEVLDTGIGIAAHDIARVMEPFGQVESAQSRKHQGTGLGLPLTRRLVELHGGRMTIDSALGRGTSVKLDLPAAKLAVGAEPA